MYISESVNLLYDTDFTLQIWLYKNVEKLTFLDCCKELALSMSRFWDEFDSHWLPHICIKLTYADKLEE